jgi:hypothetical protein
MSTDNIDDATGATENRLLPLGPITIDKIFENGVHIEQNPLLGCFFAPEGSSGEYAFYGPKGKELHGHVTSGDTFTVETGGQRWQLQVFFSAHGTWVPVAAGHGKGVEEGGTYTAQAGGGVPTTQSASA